MSYRSTLLAMALACFPATLLADSDPMPLWDSGWELYRPAHRALEPFDLNYVTDGLRTRSGRVAFRYRAAANVTLSLQLDPLARDREQFMPVCDFTSGAAILSLRFSFDEP